MKMIQNNLTNEQEKFLKIFRKNKDYGEMSLTCEMTNISKSTIKEWSKDYSLFWGEMENIKDEKKWNLIKKVQKGDVQASMKFLQIYAKDRGYSEWEEEEDDK